MGLALQFGKTCLKSDKTLSTHVPCVVLVPRWIILFHFCSILFHFDHKSRISVHAAIIHCRFGKLDENVFFIVFRFCFSDQKWNCKQKGPEQIRTEWGRIVFFRPNPRHCFPHEESNWNQSLSLAQFVPLATKNRLKQTRSFDLLTRSIPGDMNAFLRKD